jgi:DNA-binding FadR family transcriptional regulator
MWLETGQVFLSVERAAKQLDCSKSSIRNNMGPRENVLTKFGMITIVPYDPTYVKTEWSDYVI